MEPRIRPIQSLKSCVMYKAKHSKRTIVDADYKGYAKPTDYDVVYSENTIGYDAQTGQVAFALVKQAIPEDDARRIYPALMKGFNYVTDNRGAYSGMDRVKMGKQSRHPPVRSYTAGYFERQGGRIPCCRATAFTRKETKAWSRQKLLLEHMASVMQMYAPMKYMTSIDYIKRIHPDYHVDKLPFTTTAVNLSVRAGYHRDKGDYKDGIGSIAVLMKGVCINWKLVLPEYRVALDIGDRDIILFDPHLLHATTEGSGIGEMYKDWNRISVVGYIRERLVNCLSFEDELKRAKERK